MPTVSFARNYDAFCLNPPSTHARLLCKKIGRKQNYPSYAPKSSISSPKSTKESTQSFKTERIEKRNQEKQRMSSHSTPTAPTTHIEFKPYTRGAYTKKQTS